MAGIDTAVSGICNDRSQSISLLGMMQRTKGIAQRGRYNRGQHGLKRACVCTEQASQRGKGCKLVKKSRTSGAR